MTSSAHDHESYRFAGPEVEDLRLVAAVARLGSVGAAARELRVAQPSASQRLARLERTVGVVLFDRDTRGARPTAAGHALVAEARDVLARLAGIRDAVHAASRGPVLRIGTFDSLSTVLFTALDDLLGPVDQRVDHGDRMIEWVGARTMDATFVAIADQLELPRGVVSHVVGVDRLTMLLPPGVAPAAGRQPLRGLDVVYTTYDLRSVEVSEHLAQLGARPRRAATSSIVLSIARRHAIPAVLPRSALAEGLRDGERERPLRLRSLLRLSMVVPHDPDPRLLDVLPALRRSLSLGRVPSTP